MGNRLDQATEKGVKVASAIEALFRKENERTLTFRVLTVQNHLTKVVIRRIVGEPDAAGQGGSAPPG